MEIEQMPRCQPPRLFRPHPNLSDEVNRHLVQSQIEGGVRVEDLVPGSWLQVKTQNTCYRILILFGAMALITGHPLFCPRPVLITIHGSTWGGSMLKVRFIVGVCTWNFITRITARLSSLPLSRKFRNYRSAGHRRSRFWRSPVV